MRKTIVIGMLSMMSTFANAGSYSYMCSTTIDCDGLFNDLVTDKFIARYPASKWEIYVLSDSALYTNGAVSGMAVVAVRPKRTDGVSVMPKNRYFQHSYNTDQHDPYAQNQFERDMIRNGIIYMMADCDKKKNCNID